MPQANFVSQGSQNPNRAPWLFDTGASHHITSDLENLAIHSEYNDGAEVTVGNGNTASITHSGLATLNANNHSFHLNNVLCAPTIQRNLISVSQFCAQNNTFIEFFPDSFLVKDLTTGASLVRGRSKDNLYEWPSNSSSFQAQQQRSSPLANTAHCPSPATTADSWHHRLGHPSSRVLRQTITFNNLPMSGHINTMSSCNACLCNKSHKLPFNVSSLQYSKPLEILFMDVWGPAPINAFDQSRYYVVFVDYLTKYSWLFPLKHKSDVTSIFTKFKPLVENYFQTTIRIVYTDGSGEATSLGHYLSTVGIQHLRSPPHTPEHVGTAERKHRHIAEIALALLHHASMPQRYWSLAFTTAIYRINRLPSPTIAHKSPYELLFKQPPSYHSFRSFGCLCYPWLRPYSSHKLQPRSRPCVFVGYSTTFHAYLCLDPSTDVIFTSRHVRFVGHLFLFSLPNPLFSSRPNNLPEPS
ncbi:hypothetical protein Dimus_039626 [Dionaea muscipula]